MRYIVARIWDDFEKTGRSLDNLHGSSVKEQQLWHVKKKILSTDDANKPKYQSGHFLKNAAPERGQNDAGREVAFMELWRLMVPRQPKTRYIQKIDVHTGKVQYFVQSKEVPDSMQLLDFESSSSDIPIKENSAIELWFLSVFVLFDGDDEKRNYLIDKNGYLYRIDGGMAGFFPSELSAPSQKSLVEWSEMPENKELSRVLLTFLVSTDSLFDAWADAYNTHTFDIKNDALTLKRIAHHRLIQGIQWPHFKEYLKTPQAQQAYQAHRNHVATFYVRGKNKLVKNQAILNNMDSKFQFLIDLANKPQCEVFDLLDKTSLVAQLDYLHGKVSKIKDLLAPWKERYPFTSGRINRLKPLDAPMGRLVNSLDAATEKFLKELTQTINNLPENARESLLKESYLRYKMCIENILEDPNYAELKKENSAYYSLHCSLIWAVRAFFRFFDILINGINSTKNSDPAYMPVFFYAQKSLHQEVKQLSDEFNEALVNLELQINAPFNHPSP